MFARNALQYGENRAVQEVSGSARLSSANGASFQRRECEQTCARCGGKKKNKKKGKRNETQERKLDCRKSTTCCAPESGFVKHVDTTPLTQRDPNRIAHKPAGKDPELPNGAWALQLGGGI